MSANDPLNWYRVSDGALMGTTFVPVNGQTYVTAPTNAPSENGHHEWSYQNKTAASTAGALTMEGNNTPERAVRAYATGMGPDQGPCIAGCADNVVWVSFGATGPMGASGVAIAGATDDLYITELHSKRKRLKFVPSAGTGSVGPTYVAVT